MIPKIMHRVWIGDNPMPETFKNYELGCKELHPDWEFRLWTNDDVKDTPVGYILGEPITAASKANVIRLYVVLNYGGVYCDTDFEFNKPIDVFCGHKAFAVKQRKGQFANGFFGSEKDHKWVLWQCNQIKDYWHIRPPWGPRLMTEAMKYVGHDVVILSTKYFYPYLWDEEYRPASEFPDAYAVHHWAKTWAKNDK